MTRRNKDIQRGIQEVLEINGEDRYQWGQYVERKDGETWTPLIYDGDEQTVKQWHAGDRVDNDDLRNSRVIRRAIGPWEIQ